MLSPVAMLAWTGAVSLFLLALRTWSDERAARRCARMGLAGMMLAMGAALYTHDVVSLPEMLSMAALGSGIGYLIARRAPMWSAWPIITLLQAMIGAALLLTAFAIDGNAIAFAMLTPDDARLTGTSMALLGLSKACGAIVLLGSLLLCRAMVGARAGVERWLALLASLSGWGGVAIALLLGEAGLAGMSGIVGAGGLVLGLLLRPAKTD
ncbi:MAG: NAD(P)(+) transhydrogenase (Re/Si-specific) subunit beta [Pseudomonadota bacterium]|uniref:NAD(P)(+) transhydrogenase (Re/Si-specific) subunit beta n=1 Tax=Sphingobium naphthae TaxID=1886786 RepID=UPI002B0996D0|nr:NAD(P)(+) transhydrogenase (Re/Si-specific) subunit beta [Pseudomonadota bacterium]